MLVINVLLLNFSNRVIDIMSFEGILQILSATPLIIIGFKIQCRIKSPLNQSLSESEFYGNLVYKLKKIIGRTYSLISFE